MKRANTLAVLAVTVIGSLAIVGCQSHDNDLPPGENGVHAGGNGAFGSNVSQPGEGTHGGNGTGTNGNQMELNGMH